MRRILRSVGSALISVLIFLIFLEIGCFIAIKAGWLDVELPSYSLSGTDWFWKTISPDFGPWHEPNDEMHHRKQCFDVTYNSNSFGMRDAEVSQIGGEHRVVVLGDSFVEGWGIDYGKRFTEILEQKNNVELLNFGTAGGFGSTQSYVLYKTLASAFSHDAVIFAILPDNDFSDDTPDDRLLSGKGTGRPYLVGDYPNFTLTYPTGDFEQDRKQAQAFETLMEEFWTTYRVLKYYHKYFRKLYRRSTEKKRGEAGHYYSGYYDYIDKQFDRVQYAIEQIKEIAGPRPMLVVTIPRRADFTRAEETQSIPPIRKDLTALSEALGLTYIDLMIGMDGSGTFDSYFHSCDGHWSEKGHAKAADIISGWGYFAPKGNYTRER